MRTLLRNKRGITPVLSNVLMMLIAVAGMSIAITATYIITTNYHDIMGERFIVEDVYFRAGGVSFYLRNTGKIAIKIVSVYVNHAAQSVAPLDLEIASHGWLNCTLTWVTGRVYYVSVSTIRGTQVADYYRAPS